MLVQSAAKKHAPESRKTQKAREKLLESFKKQDAQITGEALKATVEKIHKWISDQHKHRVLIKNKLIQLFDQNQNAAETSEKVKEFAQMIQNSAFAADKGGKNSPHLEPSV